jgi:hypothetical protein
MDALRADTRGLYNAQADVAMFETVSRVIHRVMPVQGFKIGKHGKDYPTRPQRSSGASERCGGAARIKRSDEKGQTRKTK